MLAIDSMETIAWCQGKDGVFCSPFGDCECGNFIEVEREKKVMVGTYSLPAVTIRPKVIQPTAMARFFRDVTLDVPDVLPTAYTRNDGETLVYEGMLNTFYGLPGVGKTWVAIDCAKEVIGQGGRVLWWDYEDSTATLGGRAKLLDFADAADQSKLGFIDSAITDVEIGMVFVIKELAAWVMGGERPGMVVIDSADRAGCPSDGADVGPWYRAMTDPWLAVGATVIVLDHIPKNAESRPEGGIGSIHKQSKVNGAAYKVSGKPWNRRKGGRITLTLEKDRKGQVPVAKGEVAAVISGEYVNGKFTYTVGTSTGGNQSDILGVKVLTYLAANPDGVYGQSVLRQSLQCKASNLKTTLESLRDDALITCTARGKGYHYAISTQGYDYLGDGEVQAELITLESTDN